MVIAGPCCQHARISVALFYVGGAFVDSVDVPQVGDRVGALPGSCPPCVHMYAESPSVLMCGLLVNIA